MLKMLKHFTLQYYVSELMGLLLKANNIDVPPRYYNDDDSSTINKCRAVYFQFQFMLIH